MKLKWTVSAEASESSETLESFMSSQRNMSCYTYSSRRVWTSGHESLNLGSEYILNKILKLQARLHVSCFNKFGFDFPLKPEKEKDKGLNSRGIDCTALICIWQQNTIMKKKFFIVHNNFQVQNLFTCPPECGPLFTVGVEVLSKGVRLQKTIKQLEEVRRGHVHVHTLVWTQVSLGIQFTQGIALVRRYFRKPSLTI